MIARLITHLVRKRLASYPAVALVGPRQSGKTTLAKSLGGRYFDLESAQDRVRIELEGPTLFRGRELVVLDEVQTQPTLFPEIRSAIDAARKRNGRFLLLGSVSPALMTRVSESLAGRIAIVELSPLLYSELERSAARERHWLMGGFPDGGVLLPRQFPNWQESYVAQLTSRDLPLWGFPGKAQVANRLLRMLAASHGQQWNASRIGQSLGLSHPTVNSYLDYLTGAFIVRSLPPWHANVGKRLVKSPKVYLRDSGILHSLLGVSTQDALLGQPWVGASWEGYVIEQVLAELAARGISTEAYHLRTSDQHEIDLVLRTAGKVHAIEVKLTARPSDEDLRRLDAVADLTGADHRYLVTRASTVVEGKRTVACNLAWLLNHFREH